MITMIPLARNMRHPSKVHIGCRKMSKWARFHIVQTVCGVRLKKSVRCKNFRIEYEKMYISPLKIFWVYHQFFGDPASVYEMTHIMIVHLKDGVLDDLDTIDDIANEQDECDDHEGDQGGVAKVLHVNVLVLVVQLQGSCRKVEIVSIVPMPVGCDYETSSCLDESRIRKRSSHLESRHPLDHFSQSFYVHHIVGSSNVGVRIFFKCPKPYLHRGYDIFNLTSFNGLENGGRQDFFEDVVSKSFCL